MNTFFPNERNGKRNMKNEHLKYIYIIMPDNKQLYSMQNN